MKPVLLNGFVELVVAPFNHMLARPMYVDRLKVEDGQSVAGVELLLGVLRDPFNPNQIQKLLDALIESGRIDESLVYTQLLLGMSLSANQRLNLGRSLLENGRVLDAIRLAGGALSSRECGERAILLAAECMIQVGEVDVGIAMSKTIRSKAKSIVALKHFVIAKAMFQKQEFENAKASLKKHCDAKMQFPPALKLEIHVYLAMGDFDSALKRARVVRELLSDDCELIGLEASALNGLELADDEESLLRTHQSRSPKLTFQLSCCLLGKQEWLQGFQLYESRWALNPNRGSENIYSGRFSVAPHFAEWRGERMNGKEMLIHCEQGLGDILQFLPFVLMLKRKRRVRIHCLAPASMVRFLKATTLFASVTPYCAGTCFYTDHIALCSLPLALGFSSSAFGEYESGRRIIGRKIARMFGNGSRSNRLKRKRIIINTSGNWLGPFDRRAVDSPLLGEVVARHSKSFDFISVSKDKPEFRNGIQFDASVVKDLGNEISDVLDTCERIVNADAVITQDTGLAHLAGLLGLNVHIMIQRISDWRWTIPEGGKCDRCLWYPTAVIHRQSIQGDWSSVIHSIDMVLVNLTK